MKGFIINGEAVAWTEGMTKGTEGICPQCGNRYDTKVGRICQHCQMQVIAFYAFGVCDTVKYTLKRKVPVQTSLDVKDAPLVDVTSMEIPSIISRAEAKAIIIESLPGTIRGAYKRMQRSRRNNSIKGQFVWSVRAA